MNIETAFARCVSTPEPVLDLARAALLIARDEAYPELDVDDYLQQLDAIAEQTRARLQPDPAVEETLHALNRTLFEDLGFTGNVSDYYDPRNSFLNDVLDRKLGIPITLSVIYIEVGRRLGVPLEGVSFPGHFLVKLRLARGEVILDPYRGGVSLSTADLADRVIEFFGSRRPSLDELQQMLAGASKKDILSRMLRNLRNVYVHHKDLERALSISNQILAVAPVSPADVRDRGMILEHLECPQAAVSDYRQYLQLLPDADDSEDIAKRIDRLQKIAPRCN